jgi:hypothetical protein
MTPTVHKLQTGDLFDHYNELLYKQAKYKEILNSNMNDTGWRKSHLTLTFSCSILRVK